jgi:uncharacterized OsmC-like protein
MMNTLRITYDELQHCTALREPQGNTVAMDCPYTGKGEEFSPGNLVGAGLAGCMLISMGTLALRDKIDISGTNVDVQMTQTDKRIEAISLLFSMPRNFSAQERVKLERAAGLCPIKNSFHPDVTISVKYKYPE